MDVYHPSRSAVDNSRNGIQLLSNLMIPSLSVNDALGTINSGGQAVQVRINGQEASVEQVRNLLPSTIKRVEWIENPGLRYNGANTVLNFIVTNPEVGGSLMVYATQALNMAWGQYNPSAKFNSGRSQVEIGGGDISSLKTLKFTVITMKGSPFLMENPSLAEKHPGVVV